MHFVLQISTSCGFMSNNKHPLQAANNKSVIATDGGTFHKLIDRQRFL